MFKVKGNSDTRLMRYKEHFLLNPRILTITNNFRTIIGVGFGNYTKQDKEGNSSMALKNSIP